MAKIVLQNQASPTTPECGFTAMYVNCNTCLPTFKLDDGTEQSFILSGSQYLGDMCKSIYDPDGCNTNIFKYVDDAIACVGGITLCPVNVLPPVGECGVIYLIPNGQTGCNTRDEYMRVEGQYELIGNTSVDLSDYAKCADLPTDNCQLSNSCGYTTCTGDMVKSMYDPNNCAADMYSMDNMTDGINKVAMTQAERTQLQGISGCNTGDETTASIKSKLGITCLSGDNTGDETTQSIKTKLSYASCADDGYLKACDYTIFANKQNELISGENIITINGETILKCGNIDICNSGGDMKACIYDPYSKCGDVYNRANHTGQQSYTTITGLGSSATRNVGTSCGNVVVVGSDGKISADVLPAQSIVDVCTFDSEEAMLQWITADRGDMAIRTDNTRTYVMSGNCPSCIDSWTILPVPASPVTTVNGKVGNVCLTTTDISDSDSTNKYVTSAEKTCWNNKAECLISGCTIKTINGCPILGSGDLIVGDIICCVNGKTGNVVLNADDICDAGTCHKRVTNSEKQCWNGKIDCADAVVDNCQLCNSCGYITNAALTNLAQCCDIPSVSGLVKECCIATINGCCLTQGGNICIQAGEGAEWAWEDIPAGSSTYTLCNVPVNKNGFMVFVDSGLGMLPTNDYSYNIGTCTITFCNTLANNETAKVWIMKKGQAGGGGGGCAEWGYIGGELCDQADLQGVLNNKANTCDLNGLAKECDIACINGCCLLCTGNICIKGGDYGWCDYIHADQSCCICPEHQLIIEGTLTVDGELINDGKIFII